MQDPNDPSKKIPYVPQDLGLDEVKRLWLYKVIVDVCQTPVSKRIVNAHRDSKDTRAIWNDLCQHYNNSMASRIRNQEIIRFLNSAVLKNLNFKGSDVAFLVLFGEHYRQYQASVSTKDQLSDAMAVDMLNNALVGTQGLQNVLDIYQTARKAAGIPDPFKISFDEYMERCIQAAQVNDSSNFLKTRTGRTVNMHDLVYADDIVLSDDDQEEEDHDNYGLEVNQSDRARGTNRNGRKNGGDNKFYKKPGLPQVRVMIPREKWNTMTRDDQIAWTKLSPQARATILGQQTPKTEGGNPRVVVNNHEIIFEDETGNEEDSSQGENPNANVPTASREIEARTHNVSRRTIEANTSTMSRSISEEKEQDPQDRGLLCLATHNTRKASTAQFDINKAFNNALTKKDTKTVAFQYDIEQPSHPKTTRREVNMARRTLRDDGYAHGLESSDEDEPPPLSSGNQNVVRHVRFQGQEPPRDDPPRRHARTRPSRAPAGGRGRGFTGGRTHLSPRQRAREQVPNR